MPKNNDDDPLAPLFKRMGEPSWLILHVLHPTHALAGIEILRRAEDLLARTNYPSRRMDPSTLHYALRRMEEDGMVRCAGEQEMVVPGPRGVQRRERRVVYVMTGLGQSALERRRQLEAALAHPTLQPDRAGGMA